MEDEEYEQEKIKNNIELTNEMAFFRKYYWKERNSIFEEIYKILVSDNKEEEKEDNGEIFEDNLSDVNDFDDNLIQEFNLDSNSNNDEFDMEMKMEVEDEDKVEDENKDEDENNDEDKSKESIDDEHKSFFNINNLKKSKKIIYKNYIEKYLKEKYIFKNKNFSLMANIKKEVFLRINKKDIFRIDYLKQIKVRNEKKEWVCNSYYGLYLLHKIKKCKNPYPVCKPENDNLQQEKTISKEDDFDYIIFNGIDEINDMNYEINLDEIIDNIKKNTSIKSIMKNKNCYSDFLNIKKEDFYKIIPCSKYLYSFYGRNYQEIFTYIFGNESCLNNLEIIEILNDQYYKYKKRFFYLDFDYIDKIKKKKDLKKYFAYWFSKVFLKNNYNDFKSAFENIVKTIDKENIVYTIKSVIKINRKFYNLVNFNEKVYIILNNVNSEKSHAIINNIKNTMEVSSDFSFLVFCNIENDYNINNFFHLYSDNEIRLIMLNDDPKDKKINYNENEIKALFSKDNDLTNFSELIKLFNFNIFINSKEIISFNIIQEISFIKKYIKFIYLECENNRNGNKPKIKNIKFKNREIETIFLKFYEDYCLNFIKNESNMNRFLNIKDSDFFENLVILDILTEKIVKDGNWKNFEKFKVKSLFGLNIDKNFNFEKYKNKNILFTQDNMTSEIFDFAILICENKKLIMKLYQVSTNKTEKDFEKLDIEIIKLHCINIQKNLYKLGEIEDFSFGIITSYTCFEKYKNNISNEFQIMKNNCDKQNYELLIYDIKDKTFKYEKNDKLINFNYLFSIKNEYKIYLPNYNSIFSKNPRFITMKNINQKYNDCIKNYLNSTDIKIIGKISYDKEFLDAKITDDDIALLISGEVIIKDDNKTSDKKSEIIIIKNSSKVQLQKDDKKKKIKIFKYNGENSIIEKNGEVVQELNNIKDISLINSHIILIKLGDNGFLKKKRKNEDLFLEELIAKKK